MLLHFSSANLCAFFVIPALKNLNAEDTEELSLRTAEKNKIRKFVVHPDHSFRK